MMIKHNVQAKLVIRLLAEDVVVAESSNPVLWQRILASVLREEDDLGGVDEGEADHEADESPLAEFARDLGVELTELQGALSPSNQPPYLHIDTRTWEAFKQNFPERGSRAVPSIVLAGTALALWFRYLELGNPTQAQARAVLATINVEAKNTTRSLRNSDWLQNRSGSLNVNPARISQAESLLRSFCRRQGPAEGD